MHHPICCNTPFLNLHRCVKRGNVPIYVHSSISVISNRFSKALHEDGESKERTACNDSRTHLVALLETGLGNCECRSLRRRTQGEEIHGITRVSVGEDVIENHTGRRRPRGVLF
ncbi:hypothetical protein XENORESO_005080 [Xenotaenia resolanae]|uniref:Uncharacterized protein n=1 Tax=Xenotaenia resolanae TaxID=208358 RepID=A0ABV0WPD0_9TELE